MIRTGRKRGLKNEYGIVDAVYYLWTYGTRCAVFSGGGHSSGDQRAAGTAADPDQCGGAGGIGDRVHIGGDYHLPVL